MKKYFMMIVALLTVAAVAMPAFADVQLKYGGQFRARWMSSDNLRDGNDDADDNINRIDQRLRLYFTFIASENLKLVTKFEVGDTTWGDNTNGRTGQGGRVGADSVNVETKNAYIDFAIPCTPARALVGIQGIALMNSWIIDDDFSAAVVKTKMKPFEFALGYIAAQNNNVTDESENVDEWFLSVDYADGPFSASFVALYQMGHKTVFNPAFWTGPWSGPLATDSEISHNNLWDLGLNLGYKVDWMSAYVTFVKNLGSIKADDETADYDGWMVDAGANFFCGPWTFNVGGFYVTGQDSENDDDDDIDTFVYPAATTKYFSEILGGGILDRDTPMDQANRGSYIAYPTPTNVWTLTAGVSYQAAEKTKLSLSYWYFATAEDVLSNDEEDEFDNSLGHEIDFYITQGIVDGLTLDIVAAYLFAGDALTANEDDDDVYELGARLQWNF